MASSEELSAPTVPKQRLSPQDYRNQDLVSRLLAATPPYLYSAPMGPHNFFFSEMLRSLVQAKANEANVRHSQSIASATQQQSQSTHLGRRPRKRSWSQHRLPFDHPNSVASSHNNNNKDFEEKSQSEKPLELTNKHSNFTLSQKCNSKSDMSADHSRENLPILKMGRLDTEAISSRLDSGDAETPPSQSVSPSSHMLPTETSTSSLPSQSDLVLPPPPPVWYPSLYPPYGIDPLHFFIDLRVSGHIYDRKKDNTSPLSYKTDNNNCQYFDLESFGKHRHGSAFSVPAPRDGKNQTAVNLSCSANNEEKYQIDHQNCGEKMDLLSLSKNTNYVMQNLPRIYTNLTTHGKHDDQIENKNRALNEEIESRQYEAKEMTSSMDREQDRRTLDNNTQRDDEPNYNKRIDDDVIAVDDNDN